MAQASMNNILKKKKKIDREKVLWVGIHVRRQDYQRYEMSLGLDPLKPSYYLEAMDMYHEFYGGKNKRLLFVVITDDVKWCETHLKGKNVFIVSKPNSELFEGIGHDLALMSKCNHTIISRGSFSYLSSALASGATILPCHFHGYKHKDQKGVNEICDRHPLKNPLEKLYPIQY